VFTSSGQEESVSGLPEMPSRLCEGKDRMTAIRSTGKRKAPGFARRARVAALAGFVCISLAMAAGCAWFKDKPELSAEENFQKGMKEFENEKHQRAIPYFQKIVENYPFSIHAVPAELKIAESYFLDKKYAEALVHLQSFEELHPTNEQIPYVIWMKGYSYLEQFSTIDRDVTSLENAERELEKLRKRFPDNARAEEARSLLVEIRQKLAEHDFYVARFYYRGGEYRAALPRFQRIIERFPEEGIADRALYSIGKCHYFMGENEKARQAFGELVSTYPESGYRSGAEMFLQDLQEGRFTIVSRYFRMKERVFRWLGYQ